MTHFYHQTPAGIILVHVQDNNIVRSEFVDQYLEEGLRELPILPFQITGTIFQKKVWDALTDIPKGKVVTYQMIADAIGHPKSVRAVGNAIGANPLVYFIPCHRVIRSDGKLGGFAYGAERKSALLRAEGIDLQNLLMHSR